MVDSVLITPENDIMRSGEEGSTVNSNHIEMLFLAALKNEKQYYYKNRNGKKSEVVTWEK